MAKHAAAVLCMPAQPPAKTALDRLRAVDPARARAIDALILYALTDWHQEQCHQPVCEWPHCGCGSNSI